MLTSVKSRLDPIFIYTYSNAGDIKDIKNNLTNITLTYEYDHLHRLVSEESSEDTIVTSTESQIIEFEYDSTPGQPVHAPARILIDGVQTEYDYTSTGNRFNKRVGLDTIVYQSNDDNLITNITKGDLETNFYYDADSKRVKKDQNVPGTSVVQSSLYFGSDFEIINETPTLYVFAGNLRVAQVTDTDTIYFHKDHLGSTNAISREDGTVIDSGEYMPYGQDRNDNALLNTSAYKFTDQEQDGGTGLYNYDARLYEPETGLFIMADTIVPDIFNPQSLNRYAYCLNNPLIYTDPSGHNVLGLDPFFDADEYDYYNAFENELMDQFNNGLNNVAMAYGAIAVGVAVTYGGAQLGGIAAVGRAAYNAYNAISPHAKFAASVALSKAQKARDAFYSAIAKNQSLANNTVDGLLGLAPGTPPDASNKWGSISTIGKAIAEAVAEAISKAEQDNKNDNYGNASKEGAATHAGKGPGGSGGGIDGCEWAGM